MIYDVCEVIWSYDYWREHELLACRVYALLWLAGITSCVLHIAFNTCVTNASCFMLHASSIWLSGLSWGRPFTKRWHPIFTSLHLASGRSLHLNFPELCKLQNWFQADQKQLDFRQAHGTVWFHLHIQRVFFCNGRMEDTATAQLRRLSIWFNANLRVQKIEKFQEFPR